MSQRGAAASAPISRAERLEEARASLLRSALGFALLACVSTAVVVIVFDWEPSEMVLGGLIGTAVFGGLRWWDRRSWVPHGMPLDAPRSFQPARPKAHTLAVILAAAAVFGFGMAWLVDAMGLGAAFIPGMWAGDALAAGVVALQVHRWERSHGRRLLVDLDSDRPYAGPPL